MRVCAGPVERGGREEQPCRRSAWPVAVGSTRAASGAWRRSRSFGSPRGGPRGGRPRDGCEPHRRARRRLGPSAVMRTWTATITVDARPEDVLYVLTDPHACARWAPVPFDVDDLGGERLLAGTRARVSGRLAGRRVGFDVEVHEADHRGLALSAHGPVAFDVAYALARTAHGSKVHASVSVRSGRGLTGRVLAEVTGALLTAGALQAAISRIAREAACC